LKAASDQRVRDRDRAPDAAEEAPARIALISPYGGGNLGDAAILESVIHGVRRRQPRAALFALTLNPGVTTERHGIPGFPCAGVRLRSYGMTDEASARPDDSRGLARLVSALPPLRKGRTLGRLVQDELRHRRRARDFLAGFREVVVAGGGQLDDLWGGAWGHPYVLAKWGGLARQAGARFSVLSVGVGVLRSRLSRTFVRRALALAAYCSFRDADSRQLAAFADVTRALVVPDLAYGLAVERPVETARAGRRPVVAVSPLAYGDPRVWPDKDPAHYQHHVASVADLCGRILAQGWEIVLFFSDSPDAATVGDVLAILDARLTPEERARVRTPETRTLPALLRELAPVDLVVAGRLHGVLIAHVLGKPVLALAYERKVTALMSGMQHQALCLPIRGLDPRLAMTTLAGMLERREDWAADVRGKVSAYRRLVDGQYDHLFGAAESPPS
jgi:polysaccharide pyruvyl transferase WcaK-like protein